LGIRRAVDLVGLVVLAAALVVGCSTDNTVSPAPRQSNPLSSGRPGATPTPFAAGTLLELARKPIKHVLVVMQENRSFDSYFGTYPGADGIPMQDGAPAVCVPDPDSPYVAPYHEFGSRGPPPD
jgi:phospholipase C